MVAGLRDPQQLLVPDVARGRGERVRARSADGPVRDRTVEVAGHDVGACRGRAASASAPFEGDLDGARSAVARRGPGADAQEVGLTGDGLEDHLRVETAAVVLAGEGAAAGSSPAGWTARAVSSPGVVVRPQVDTVTGRVSGATQRNQTSLAIGQPAGVLVVAAPLSKGKSPVPEMTWAWLQRSSPWANPRDGSERGDESCGDRCARHRGEKPLGSPERSIRRRWTARLEASRPTALPLEGLRSK